MQWHANWGPWSREEKGYHIICLELVAATLALKSILKHQVNKHVLLLIDNQTAVADIKNQGRTASPPVTVLVKGRWMWCLERGILLSAQYSPGEENVIVDAESWEMKDCSDWKLNPSIFRKIWRHFPDLSINLFASHVTFPIPMLLQLEARSPS